MARKPPPPRLPAGLEAWAGPTTLGPASTAPAPSASALGPEPSPPAVLCRGARSGAALGTVEPCRRVSDRARWSRPGLGSCSSGERDCPGEPGPGAGP
eukprot:2509409-Lingulodinium_polyedra.AAC.1